MQSPVVHVVMFLVLVLWGVIIIIIRQYSLRTCHAALFCLKPFVSGLWFCS